MAKIQTAALRQYWAERNPREQRLLVAMVAVIAVAALWALFDWQAAEYKRLGKLVPRVQAQVKAMQDDAAELARLRVAPKRPAADAKQLADTLQNSAAALHLALTVRNDGDRIIVSGTSVPFDAFVAWLAAAQTQNALKVASLDASPNNDGQRIEVRLMQSR
ncbi:MAG: type II secretion system protein GspM [Rhodocyclaceae bacterium]